MNFSIRKNGDEFLIKVDDSFPLSEIQNVRVTVTVSKSGKKKPYCYLIGKGRSIYLHRFITGASKGLVVDHINGDPLDNRIENLRVCTHKENIRNMSKPDKGVSFCKERKKWHASIMVDGKNIALGRFLLKEDALQAYSVASKFYHKEFGVK